MFFLLYILSKNPFLSESMLEKLWRTGGILIPLWTPGFWRHWELRAWYRWAKVDVCVCGSWLMQPRVGEWSLLIPGILTQLEPLPENGFLNGQETGGCLPRSEIMAWAWFVIMGGGCGVRRWCYVISTAVLSALQPQWLPTPAFPSLWCESRTHIHTNITECKPQE